MCPSLFSAYLLVMSSASGIACVPMDTMATCQKAISDFSANFVETRRNSSPKPLTELKGTGYTIITPKKPQQLGENRKPEFSLTCVRAKKTG
jgi:hypothetical protein